LGEYLSIYNKNYQFCDKYKNGTWDGKTHFLKNDAFPTGLLSIVLNFLVNEKIQYEIEDKREKPPIFFKEVNDSFLENITLTKDQVNAVNTALSKGRGIIKMATGTGKTEVAIAITKAVSLKTLFLVNSKTLLHQTKERFQKRMPTCNIALYGDGYKENGDIVIATSQSFNALKKKDFSDFKSFLSHFKVIICDECHHAQAKTWYTIAMFCNAYYRFGFSGTPLNNDKCQQAKLIGSIGQKIYELSAKNAMNKKILSSIDLEIVENTETLYPKTYNKIYNSAIVCSISRNGKICNIAKKHFEENKKVLIIVKHIEHGEKLTKMLQKCNIPIIWLHGKLNQNIRQAGIVKFSCQKYVLVGSGIFDEGVDIPEINVLIIAAGGKSDIKTIQRIGRGLRKKSDDLCLKAYDFLDHSKYVFDHSLERIKTYKQEGFLA
jgi:superfamily II DNA or RNA helicase